MDTLSRVMHEAAADAPTTLAQGDGWVEASWRSGRRRRALRGVAASVGLAAAAALVFSLVVSGVGGMPSASVPADGSSRSDREGVTSYPQRIGHQWWVRDLPSAPGPVAGLVESLTQDGDETLSSWAVVTAAGTRYRLPEPPTSTGVFPAVSDDGTHVGWLADDGAYRIQDLSSGAVRSFPGVGNGNLVSGSGTEFVGGRPYGLQAQSPAFFSPSGRAVAMLASSGGGPDWSGVLVLADDGSAIEVPGMAMAGGWIDDDRLIGRVLDEQTDAERNQQGDTGVDIVVWDRRSGLTRPLVRLELPKAEPNTVNQLNGQFWGAVRSDGTLWLSYSVEVPSGSASRNQHVAGYALPSGRPVGVDGRPRVAPAPAFSASDGGGLVSFMRFWHRTTPLAGTDGDVSAVVPASRPDDPLTVVDSSVGADQVIWAQDAIDGSPSWSPFGTSTFWLLWWWKEIALAALVIAAARWWLVRRRTRRTRRQD